MPARIRNDVRQRPDILRLLIQQLREDVRAALQGKAQALAVVVRKTGSRRRLDLSDVRFENQLSSAELGMVASEKSGKSPVVRQPDMAERLDHGVGRCFRIDVFKGGRSARDQPLCSAKVVFDAVSPRLATRRPAYF